MALAYLAFAWVLGIAAAAFTDASLGAVVAAAGLLGAASFAWRPRVSTVLFVITGIGLICVATWRYDSAAIRGAPAGIARYNDAAPVKLRAVVDDEPEARSSSRLYRLEVREAMRAGEWRPQTGGVLMRAPLFPRYEYGDLLEISGKLETPPVLPDFDYRDHLLRQGITSIVNYPQAHLLKHDEGSPFRSALIDARSSLSGALSDVLPEPEASLAGGILFGARAAIPRDLRDDMNATGTSHLVAVSGQNVTMVAGLLIALLAWLVGRRPAAWLALAGVLGYAVLVGAQPSVVRAAVMGSIYVMSIAVGRQHTAWVALLIAAAGMTALDPATARDVSFQLSFAATLGLMTLAPLLRERMERAIGVFPLSRPIAEMLSVTAAAIAFTLPITAVNFGRISLVAPLANLLAVPAFVAVAVTAAVAAAADLLLPSLSGLLAWLAWPPAAYMVAAVRWCASLPFAAVEVDGIGTGHAIVYYGLLLYATWLLWRRPLAPPLPAARAASPEPRRLAPALGLAVLLALASAFVWLAFTAPASGRLTVTFLDVGQGDAILIEAPQGQRILVDGGPSGEAITAALSRNLPFFDRRIDLVVLTHPQADHLGGLPAVLENYDVRAVLADPVPDDSAVYDIWAASLRGAGLAATPAERGQTIDLHDGAQLAVLSPAADVTAADADSPNDTSVVLRLTMGEISFLLTGDISERAESAIIRAGNDVQADVLKVAHHGSLTSTSPLFLRRVRPLLDVISVGADNRFGHPAPEVLRRLQDDTVLRTDLNGDVTVSTDGERLWVETQRNGDAPAD